MPSTLTITEAIDSYAYIYDLAGQRTNVTRTDGSYVNYAYDKIGQLTVRRAFESNNSTRSHERFGYKYDAAQNLQYRTNNSLLETFTLNNLNQISSESRNTSYTVAGFTTSAATNVTVNGNAATRYADSSFSRDVTLSDGTNRFTATALDSYGRSDSAMTTAYLPASISFSYDANGNLLSDGRRHFTCDDENQLTQVVVTNATKSIFVYDGKMRRRVRIEAAWFNNAWLTNEEVRYVYDNMLVVQERHFDPQVSTLRPQQTVTYTRGNDLSGTREQGGGIGGLLARNDEATSSSATYHGDGNGNVTALISSNGLLAAQYIYSSFGNVIVSAGALANVNMYRFSSEETHSPSGLSYYLYRYYEPSLHRWINRDPIREKGGMNLYRFVKNAPVSIVDRFGLSACTDEADDILANCRDLCKEHYGDLMQRIDDAEARCKANARDASFLPYDDIAWEYMCEEMAGKTKALIRAGAVGWRTGCYASYAVRRAACLMESLPPMIR